MEKGKNGNIQVKHNCLKYVLMYNTWLNVNQCRCTGVTSTDCLLFATTVSTQAKTDKMFKNQVSVKLESVYENINWYNITKI